MATTEISRINRADLATTLGPRGSENPTGVYVVQFQHPTALRSDLQVQPVALLLNRQYNVIGYADHDDAVWFVEQNTESVTQMLDDYSTRSPWTGRELSGPAVWFEAN
jgi:hypothetical protein